MRHIKYRPGSLVLLRQLDSLGKVATIWGGQVLTSEPKALSVPMPWASTAKVSGSRTTT